MAKNYKLADAMRDKGFSTYGLATWLGISRSCINRYLDGGSPLVSRAIRIAKALDVNVEDIFECEVVK